MCSELITAKIYKSSAKEEVREDNSMMVMVRTRILSKRVALSDFFFGSSNGSTYEDADVFTLIMETKKWMRAHSLTPYGVTSRRVGSVSKITMIIMTVTVRIMT